jgi:outer membrane protein OmpA-like peptidoglycan-associated protein
VPSLKRFIIVAALLAVVVPRVRAQDDGSAQAGLSREMRIAIRFYERGEDVQAMDRFMEILTQGEPSERAMANEYINLITRRMNIGGGVGGNPAPPAGDVTAVPVGASAAPAAGAGAVVATGVAAPVRRPVRLNVIEEPGEAAPRPPGAAARVTRGEKMSAADRAVMRKEIKARLRAAQEKSLDALKSFAGLRVVMRDNGDPAALGIPSSLLFDAGITFRRDAGRILDPLTKLVFALGSTQVVILPEGTAEGDAKVLDMRRTMGISSTLFQAGVAPPRVHVNLLNTQVDIPSALADFKGVDIVFQYDQPMDLAVESAVGEELGPPISLGIFPDSIDPSLYQGAIIEFSVSDPPVGLVSWKFQLLRPAKGGQELEPLQEVVGGGPVFHQIFWNARRNYYGDPLPAGRYECVLTALNAKDRRRTLHRWIQVRAPQETAENPLATPAPSRAAAAQPERESAGPAASIERVAAPSEDLPGASAEPLVKGVKPAVSKVEIRRIRRVEPRRRIVRRSVRPRRASRADKGRAAKESQPLAAAAKARTGRKPARRKKAASGHYVLRFRKNTHQMTASSEAELARAADAVSSYPLETLKVVGHAAADETGAAALADRRAKMVAGLLINRYQVAPSKIQVDSSVGPGASVELVMAQNER